MENSSPNPPFPFATSEFKNKSAEVLANPFPKKLLCQNFVRIEAPPHCPNTWRAEPQKEKSPFHFRKKKPPQKQKKKRKIFFFLVWGEGGGGGGGGGFRRAYDLVSSHHALRAWHISDFGNRCELGTIKTPKQNLTAFSKPEGGKINVTIAIVEKLARALDVSVDELLK